MTPEHLCLVRFTKKANARKVVYLMRRGNNWRIGQTQLRNVDGVVMLGTKLRMEGADALWVLRIVETGNDALYYEQLYSTMYQIPQLRFTYTRMDGTSGILKQEQLDMIHACSDSHAHALRCLNAFSLDIRYPFWTLARSASKLGGKVTFTLEACNVLPDVMIMMDTTRVWQSLSVSVSHMKRGYVYSIAVEKYKNYFADGVLVHNCIYRWSGADVKFFMGLPGERRILNQSFRLPRVVHALSSAIIKRVKTRVPKVFRARDAEGAIKYHPSFESLDIGEGKWLWLVRNRYLLAGLRGALQRNGIVFSSHGHSSINESERDAIYDWERLRSGKSVPVHRVRDIYSYLKSRTQIKHGFKLLPGVDESAELIMIELIESYGLLATGTWFEVFTSIPDERRAYYRALLRNRKTLKLAPQVQLETIHGSKGAEADNVAVFLEQSRRVWDESQHNIESAEDEHRVFYVAATRAKESLHVVSSGARWGYMMPTVSMK